MFIGDKLASLFEMSDYRAQSVKLAACWVFGVRFWTLGQMPIASSY